MSSGFTALQRASDPQRGRDAILQSSRISIVIPAINESTDLNAFLPQRLPEEVCEVILVDGGSTDDTREIARRLGWQVISSPRGRAVQMNAGAAIARGDVLLFVHADTRLPADFAAQITAVLAAPKVVAGAFHLQIGAGGIALRVIEKLANFRSRWLKMPFGDQAIFVLTSEYRAVGGYPEIPIMEDVELIRRLRRRGCIALARSSVVTSARRWERLGVLRTTILNVWCQVAYRFGASPARLHRWYYGRRCQDDNICMNVRR
jgi:rSAM/selenodomain-associated transferase 2